MLVFTAAAYDKPIKDTIEIDEALFPRIASGEDEPFKELYLICRDAVFSYAFSLLRNPADADDITSEVFLKIRCAAHLYKPGGKPLAWIFTITKNLCLMKLREQKKVAELEDYYTLPEDRISDREDRIVLETAMKKLSPDEYRVVILHAVTGLKHREIASLLGLALSTVLSRYNRGIKKLRKELENLL